MDDIAEATGTRLEIRSGWHFSPKDDRSHSLFLFIPLSLSLSLFSLSASPCSSLSCTQFVCLLIAYFIDTICLCRSSISISRNFRPTLILSLLFCTSTTLHIFPLSVCLSLALSFFVFFLFIQYFSLVYLFHRCNSPFTNISFTNITSLLFIFPPFSAISLAVIPFYIFFFFSSLTFFLSPVYLSHTLSLFHSHTHTHACTCTHGYAHKAIYICIYTKHKHKRKNTHKQGKSTGVGGIIRKIGQ